MFSEGECNVCMNWECFVSLSSFPVSCHQYFLLSLYISVHVSVVRESDLLVHTSPQLH